MRGEYIRLATYQYSLSATIHCGTKISREKKYLSTQLHKKCHVWCILLVPFYCLFNTDSDLNQIEKSRFGR